MNIVIIGNSAAAIGCIEAVRKNSPDDSITVVSDELYHTYSRPLISYYLEKKTDERRMRYRPDDFYDKMSCNLMLGERAESIEKGCVVLKSGKKVSFDKLLVATGSRPFVPVIDGIDSVKQHFSFMTFDDAKRLEKALTKNSRVLIMGAGFTGLKCAEGIRDLCGDITVVDMADRILPAVLDERSAEIVQKHLEKNSIKFILSQSVCSFNGNKAFIKSGAQLEFDVLITAVGVRPNSGLVADVGGEADRGIVVDENGKTSIDNVYAAGDCTLSHDISDGQKKVLALWPNAYMQGEAAGYAMYENYKPYKTPFPLNAAGFFGLHIATAGSQSGESVVTEDENGYKRLFISDNHLKGFIIVGNVSRCGIYSKLIREQISLGEIDTKLAFEKPSLSALSKDERIKMLAK